MKKQSTTIVIALSLIVGLSVMGIAAGLGGAVTAKVPFDFNVSGKTLPAGKYNITKATTQDMLIIQNAETHEAVAVITQKMEEKMGEKAKLVFHQYGAKYFLASVSDGQIVRELPTTKAERNAARGGDHLAKNIAMPEIVDVRATSGQ